MPVPVRLDAGGAGVHPQGRNFLRMSRQSVEPSGNHMRSLTAVLSALMLGPVLALSTSSPAQGAGAEFGNGCTATAPFSGVTLVMTASDPATALPVAAPVGGVITSARIPIPRN